MESNGRTQWRAEEVIAGNADVLKALRRLIAFPLLYSREAQLLGHQWSRGLLLYGPRGTGKKSMVRAVARECDAYLIFISAQSARTSHAGKSEKILREAFAEASSHAKSGKPSVIFIDEIEALCPRGTRSQQDIRVTTQLCILMKSNKSSSTSASHVVVVASAKSLDAVSPDLRRPGCFDAEIEVSKPNEDQRLQILKLYTKNLPLDSRDDLQRVAASCNGYVGADLEALCHESIMLAEKRSSDVNQDGGHCSITIDDWEHARSVVPPSIKGGVTEIPNVSWEDIGGLKDLKKELQQAVEWPLKYSDAFSRLGVQPIRGILLHGPPGCSKTTLAKAVAHSGQFSFFSLSNAELYSMYVGESEALLRNTFRRARLAAPSIVFFDEIDGIATKRGVSSKSAAVGERLLTTLLTEMDGLEQAKGILVLGATNRPHVIDDALLRAGRFDKVLYVPPPDSEGRYEILQVHARKLGMELDDDVDLRQIAENAEFFTGAELEYLCIEAGIVARREGKTSPILCNRHFQAVLRCLRPDLTKEEINSYISSLKNPRVKASCPLTN